MLRNPKILLIAIIASMASWMFYTGADELLSASIGTISPWVKIGTAIGMAVIGVWKLGG